MNNFTMFTVNEMLIEKVGTVFPLEMESVQRLDVVCLT